MLSVRFWGDRGSIPCPGPNTVVFGGNTSCLEIRADEKLVIVDLGTGIKPFGDWLMANDFKKNGPIDTDIFITHTHWDHIMGFPMFTPIFVPGTKLRIRGPVSYEDDSLESIIGAQLSYRYWPVRQSELSAQIEYDQIKETELDLGGGLRVITKYLNHPILCLGYRFEYQGKSIVTAYDTEPFRNVFPTDPEDPSYDEFAAMEGESAAREENEKMLRFFKDADVLIHDTQYTKAEYEKDKVGWGHSSYEYAINAAHKAGVNKLVLFHHDPNRTDVQLEDLETAYRRRLAGKTTMEIMMAREGLTVEA
ncbi:MBL fold metallo-hydrolase [Breznakiella homolactica]|uniref:MBL fold metallo-hydrolase n=1 Tax=Breznakiella homolactica TaxID=2798577 RepID=A0A7T8BAE9_9SPIR|nr:MBL fold metallo-hydrolase [Breznakiella homolactica]QQO09452.1 MBL fold metallo-hydrolase [Breznakiella homolactica]